MNYLFRYLSTLLPEEAEQLREIEMTPREREVLDVLQSLLPTPEATKQEAMERLRMSGSMFDKTCSLLLRVILDGTCPEPTKLLEHLAKRVVYDLFLHELRRQEKECQAAGDKELLAQFYADAFRVLHLHFNSHYSERIARQYAAKYMRLNPSPDLPIYIEASIARMVVWIEAARRTGDHSEIRRIEKRLAANDARITEETGAWTRYQQLKTWISYYGQLKRNPDRRMECLRAALDLCERYPEVLSREEKVATLCQIAEEHYFYKTDLATPLRMYRELYARYPDVLENEVYHTHKHIQLSIINGAYDEAEALLIRFFGDEPNMLVHGGGRSKGIALLWTKLMIMTGRLDRARHYLDLAVLLNQKGFYLQFEVECRMMHTAICYLEGDFDTVELRLPAHIKFLRSKGATFKGSRFYPWFFKLVGAFIDERTTGKKLPPRLERKLEEYGEGAAAQYGVVLWKLRRMK